MPFARYNQNPLMTVAKGTEMRTLMSWLMGFALGAAIGAALVMLFAPLSGQELINALKKHYEDALQAGRQAAAQKQAELEAQLVQMRTRN
jgi:gas vesicle protein